MKLRC